MIYVGHGAHIEVRGQFHGVSSLLLPLFGFQGLNSGPQTFKQVCLLHEPSWKLQF